MSSRYGKLRTHFFRMGEKGAGIYELEDEIDALAKSEDEEIAELAADAKEKIAEIYELIGEDSPLDEILQALEELTEGEN